MTRRPLGLLPQHASDETYTSGTYSGELTKIEPTSGEQATGWVPGYRPPAQKHNYEMNKLLDNVDYLIDVPIINWHHVISKDAGGTTLDINHFRNDGTCDAFWNSTFCEWFVLGVDQVGKYYRGDHGDFLLSTLTSPIKFTFGCEANGRILVFSSDSGATAPPYLYTTPAGVPTSVVNSSLSGAVTTDAQANAVAILSTGRVIVVGGGDDKLWAWYSDDDGLTWTRVEVGDRVTAGFNLNRVVVGPDDQIVTFVRADTTDGGDSLWVSDDLGLTWTERTAIGFDNIFDVCYSAEQSRYFFSTVSLGVQYCEDAAVDSFTAMIIPAEECYAIACFGSVVLLSTVVDKANNLYRIMAFTDTGDNLATVHRPPSLVKFLGVNDQGQFVAVMEEKIHFSMKAAGHR